MDASATLPLMRLLQAPPLPPVFLLEDVEIGQRQRLPPMPELSFGMFIDDQLRVHFELNHALNVMPPAGWKDFFFPMRRYLSMAPKLIERSFLKGERRLIGGLYAVYRSEEKQVTIYTTGVLPPQELPDVPLENRLKAFDVMSQRLHEFNRWLGADLCHSGPTVIPAKVMRRIGWEEYRLKKWKNIWQLYKSSFPMCLRMRVRVYGVRYNNAAVLEK